MQSDHVGKKGGKRDRTRAALIAAALEVVEEKGFVAASLDEIAARAGMTKGAIYSNFHGKADLMFEAATSQSLGMSPEMDDDVPLEARLDAFARAVRALFPRTQGQRRVRTEFLAYAATEPELAQRIAVLHKEAFDEMGRQLEEMLGDRLRIPARTVVVAASALVTGFLYQHLAAPEETTEDVIAMALKTLIAGAMIPETGA